MTHALLHAGNANPERYLACVIFRKASSIIGDVKMHGMLPYGQGQRDSGRMRMTINVHEGLLNDPEYGDPKLTGHTVEIALEIERDCNVRPPLEAVGEVADGAVKIEPFDMRWMKQITESADLSRRGINRVGNLSQKMVQVRRHIDQGSQLRETEADGGKMLQRRVMKLKGYAAPLLADSIHDTPANGVLGMPRSGRRNSPGGNKFGRRKDRFGVQDGLETASSFLRNGGFSHSARPRYCFSPTKDIFVFGFDSALPRNRQPLKASDRPMSANTVS
nr:hypothetical protein [Microvirga flavescens]